jgi:hypothetical protein
MVNENIKNKRNIVAIHEITIDTIRENFKLYQLGNGSFAVAFELPDSTVLKVTFEDTGFHAWYKECIKMQDNPHVPKFFGHWKTKKRTVNFYHMEKLKSASNDDFHAICKDLYMDKEKFEKDFKESWNCFDLVVSSLGIYDIGQDEFEGAIGRVKPFTKYAKDVYKKIRSLTSYEKFLDDFCSRNVMIRQIGETRHLVITDPIMPCKYTDY